MEDKEGIKVFLTNLKSNVKGMEQQKVFSIKTSFYLSLFVEETLIGS